MAMAMVGIMLPSTTLTYLAARWGHENRELRGVRAFKQGMAPIVIALLIATGWILATGSNYALRDWPIWLMAIVSAAHRLAHQGAPAVAAGGRRAAGLDGLGLTRPPPEIRRSPGGCKDNCPRCP